MILEEHWFIGGEQSGFTLSDHEPGGLRIGARWQQEETIWCPSGLYQQYDPRQSQAFACRISSLWRAYTAPATFHFDITWDLSRHSISGGNSATIPGILGSCDDFDKKQIWLVLSYDQMLWWTKNNYWGESLWVTFTQRNWSLHCHFINFIWDVVCKFITLSFRGLLALIGDDCSISVLIAIVHSIGVCSHELVNIVYHVWLGVVDPTCCGPGWDGVFWDWSGSNQKGIWKSCCHSCL